MEEKREIYQALNFHNAALNYAAISQLFIWAAASRPRAGGLGGGGVGPACCVNTFHSELLTREICPSMSIPWSAMRSERRT